MVGVCAVPMCKNRSTNRCKSFFTVPRDKKLRKIWGFRMRLEEHFPLPLLDYMRVCSDHFVETDFVYTKNKSLRRLKKGACPSVFGFTRNKVKKASGKCIQNGFEEELEPPPDNDISSGEENELSDTPFMELKTEKCSEPSIIIKEKSLTINRQKELQIYADKISKNKGFYERSQIVIPAVVNNSDIETTKENSKPSIILSGLCNVPHCSNSSSKGFFLHEVPDEKALVVINLKDNKSEFVSLDNAWMSLAQVGKHDKVCSEHFLPEDYIPGTNHVLQMNAFPSKYLPPDAEINSIVFHQSLLQNNENTEKKAYQNLCRICATIDCRMVKIFGWYGRANRIKNKISKFLDIEVSADDTVMPQRICKNCVTKLEGIKLLGELAMKTDTTLRKILIAKNDELKETSKEYDNSLEVLKNTDTSSIPFLQQGLRQENNQNEVLPLENPLFKDSTCKNVKVDSIPSKDTLLECSIQEVKILEKVLQEVLAKEKEIKLSKYVLPKIKSKRNSLNRKKKLPKTLKKITGASCNQNVCHVEKQDINGMVNKTKEALVSSNSNGRQPIKDSLPEIVSCKIPQQEEKSEELFLMKCKPDASKITNVESADAQQIEKPLLNVPVVTEKIKKQISCNTKLLNESNPNEIESCKNLQEEEQLEEHILIKRKPCTNIVNNVDTADAQQIEKSLLDVPVLTEKANEELLCNPNLHNESNQIVSNVVYTQLKEGQPITDQLQEITNLQSNATNNKPSNSFSYTVPYIISVTKSYVLSKIIPYASTTCTLPKHKNVQNKAKSTCLSSIVENQDYTTNKIKKGIRNNNSNMFKLKNWMRKRHRNIIKCKKNHASRNMTDTIATDVSPYIPINLAFKSSNCGPINEEKDTPPIIVSYVPQVSAHNITVQTPKSSLYTSSTTKIGAIAQGKTSSATISNLVCDIPVTKRKNSKLRKKVLEKQQLISTCPKDKINAIKSQTSCMNKEFSNKILPATTKVISKDLAEDKVNKNTLIPLQPISANIMNILPQNKINKPYAFTVSPSKACKQTNDITTTFYIPSEMSKNPENDTIDIENPLNQNDSTKSSKINDTLLDILPDSLFPDTSDLLQEIIPIFPSRPESAMSQNTFDSLPDMTSDISAKITSYLSQNIADSNLECAGNTVSRLSYAKLPEDVPCTQSHFESLVDFASININKKENVSGKLADSVFEYTRDIPSKGNLYLSPHICNNYSNIVNSATLLTGENYISDKKNSSQLRLCSSIIPFVCSSDIDNRNICCNTYNSRDNIAKKSTEMPSTIATYLSTFTPESEPDDLYDYQPIYKNCSRNKKMQKSKKSIVKPNKKSLGFLKKSNKNIFTKTILHKNPTNNKTRKRYSKIASKIEVYLPKNCEENCSAETFDNISKVKSFTCIPDRNSNFNCASHSKTTTYIPEYLNCSSNKVLNNKSSEILPVCTNSNLNISKDKEYNLHIIESSSIVNVSQSSKTIHSDRLSNSPKYFSEKIPYISKSNFNLLFPLNSKSSSILKSTFATDKNQFDSSALVLSNTLNANDTNNVLLISENMSNLPHISNYDTNCIISDTLYNSQNISSEINSELSLKNICNLNLNDTSNLNSSHIFPSTSESSCMGSTITISPSTKAKDNLPEVTSEDRLSSDDSPYITECMINNIINETCNTTYKYPNNIKSDKIKSIPKSPNNSNKVLLDDSQIAFHTLNELFPDAPSNVLIVKNEPCSDLFNKMNIDSPNSLYSRYSYIDDNVSLPSLSPDNSAFNPPIDSDDNSLNTTTPKICSTSTSYLPDDIFSPDFSTSDVFPKTTHCNPEDKSLPEITSEILSKTVFYNPDQNLVINSSSHVSENLCSSEVTLQVSEKIPCDLNTTMKEVSHTSVILPNKDANTFDISSSYDGIFSHSSLIKHPNNSLKSTSQNIISKKHVLPPISNNSEKNISEMIDDEGLKEPEPEKLSISIQSKYSTPEINNSVLSNDQSSLPVNSNDIQPKKLFSKHIDKQVNIPTSTTNVYNYKQTDNIVQISSSKTELGVINIESNVSVTCSQLVMSSEEEKINKYAKKNTILFNSKLKKRQTKYLREPPLFNKTCKYCLQKFNRNVTLQNHIRRKHKINNCYKCKLEFDSNMEYVIHMNKHHKVTCKFCNTSIFTGALKLHIESLHAKLIPTFAPSLDSNYIDKVECEICLKISKSKKAAKNHYFWQHQVYACDVCLEIFSTFEEQMQHLQEIHAIPCSYCAEFSYTSRRHKRHMCQAHRLQSAEKLITIPKKDNEIYECAFCKKGIVNKIHYKRHVFWSHFKFACSICLEAFPSEALENIHMKNHGFMCVLCLIKYDTQLELSKHCINIHPDYKPFTCEHCGVCFKKRNELKEHKVKHQPDKSHLCFICGKIFHTYALWYAHSLYHKSNEEKSCICNICDKKFNFKSQLKSHMVSHTYEKLFKCTDCKQSFSTSALLEFHILTHLTNIRRNFACNFCNLSFVKKLNLKLHIKKHIKNNYK